MAVVRVESHRDAPEQLAAYRCPHCKGYHLTRAKQHTNRWPFVTAA